MRFECEGQMDLSELFADFDDRFCFDSDINEIVSRLDKLTGKYSVDVGKKDFEIWEHAKKYGYRLTYYIRNYNDNIPDCFFIELQDIVTFAKSHRIELAPINGYKSIIVFSDFLDGRKKIK